MKIFSLLFIALFLSLPTFAEAQTHTFTLRWQDNATNEEGTKIERCQGAACTNFAEVFSLIGGNLVEYKDSVPNTGTGNLTYRYRIRAFNSAGLSPYSNIADGITPAIVLPPTNAPTGLTVSAISSSTLELSWLNPDGTVSQRITAYRSKPWKTETITVAASADSYRDSGLKKANTSCYTVAALYMNGISAESNRSCGTTRR